MKPLRTINLVACSSAKLDHAAEARHLYCSSWFTKVRELVDVDGAEWFILSAKHGLVAPGQWLAPYDVSLHTLGPLEFSTWKKVVARAVLSLAKGQRIKFVIWAGRRYRRDLSDELQAAGHIVEVPLAGLGIGEQLQKLNQILEGKLAKLRTCPCGERFTPRTMRHTICKPSCEHAPALEVAAI
jgi:hypothetical protein